MNPVARNRWNSTGKFIKINRFAPKINHLNDPDFHKAINEAYEGEVRIYRGVIKQEETGDEEPAQIEVFISPVYENNFTVGGIVLVYLTPGIEDITTLTRENQQLQSQTFLSNITHELRTPLNWMLGFSELIEKEKDIQKIREYNENIRHGGKVLLTYIEKLIEMSMLIRDVSKIEIHEFSLMKILNETRAIISNEIRILDKKINVDLNVSLNDSKKDIQVKSDQRKLKQVLTYLTHNALKFTTSGYIEVGCRELPANMILFYVKDTGIGISEDVLHYIFEIFRKDTHYSPFFTEGQGLGLTLTKAYVSLMDGDIWVESQSGKGTQFYFTIKNHDSSATPEPNKEKIQAERNLFSALRKTLSNIFIFYKSGNRNAQGSRSSDKRLS
ncbi:MAG: sensor histidine kinase [Bacteroidota bacterium]